MNELLSPSTFEKRLAELAAFEPGQAAVRRAFGLPVKDREGMARLAEFWDPPSWAAGCVSLHDAMFLYDAVRGLSPRRVIEIGVASGGSSTVMLRALAGSGDGVLESFDLHPFCYFDRSKPVGCLAREMAPELLDRWNLNVRETAREAGARFAGQNIELAFIDGDHRHPAPTADLLWLLPALAPGAWVILHDVDLPNVAAAHEKRTGEKVNWGQRGGRELFEGWPWEKVRGGTVWGTKLPGVEDDAIGATNIGAVRIPEGGVRAGDLRHVVESVWEMQCPEEMKRVLGV